MVKKRHAEIHRDEAKKAAELTLLSLFGVESPDVEGLDPKADAEGDEAEENVWLTALRNGDLDSKEVEVEVPVSAPENAQGSGQSQIMFTMMQQGLKGGKPVETKRMTIKDARPLVEEQV
jgi:ATP-dependent protease HslVU (ClpYQ) ATPase subunit